MVGINIQEAPINLLGVLEALQVEQAIGLAQAQASKLHELRAATSLARLWANHGRSADGKNLLQPVYDWFTEGLDAPDLVSARTVLGGVAADLQQREDA